MKAEKDWDIHLKAREEQLENQNHTDLNDWRTKPFILVSFLGQLRRAICYIFHITGNLH